MPERIHIVIDDRERQAFKARATAEGVSLSEWLREAARERLHRERPAEISRVEDLDRFFTERREAEMGAEPEWEQHVSVMDSSRRGGLESS
jgi:hypothetical protein